MTGKELYYARKKARFCVRCGALLDDDDGVRCKSCVAKQKERDCERTVKRKESRICRDCGRPLEEDNKGSRCKKCKAKINRRGRLQRKERIQAGLCTQCGKRSPREGNVVCEKCHEASVRYDKARKQRLAEAKAKEDKQ